MTTATTILLTSILWAPVLGFALAALARLSLYVRAERRLAGLAGVQRVEGGRMVVVAYIGRKAEARAAAERVEAELGLVVEVK